MPAPMITRRALALTGAMSLALGLAACGGSSDPLSNTTSAAGGTAAAGSIVVGSANFPESELLMYIYSGALKAKGVSTTTKPNIGSREVYLPALQDGSIDLIPEYTGVLGDYFAKKAGKELTGGSDAETVYKNLVSVVPDTLTVLDKSAAEDKDAVVVTKETADKYKLTSIADLAPVAGELILGGPPEWKERETGAPGLKKVYGITFKEFKALDAGGPLTVNALKNDQVQAADLFTTDPNIAANNFVILQDPKDFFEAQNVVPLITKSKSNDTVASALNGVSSKLDTQTLGDLVKQVVIDKKDADKVAEQFLKDKGLAS